MRTPRGVFFGLLALSLFPETLAAGQGMPDGEAAAASKVGTVLSSLYEAYRSHERLGDGTVFVSKDPMFRIVEDRVVIDAVASGETDALRGDLDVLGMQEAASFGRVVSGQLPIRAIADVNALESLQFARPAGAEKGELRPDGAPQPGKQAD